MIEKSTFSGILLFFAAFFSPLILPSQVIWPGDINDNGVVNGKDMLRWGYALGATGPARLVTGSSWHAYPQPDPWSRIFPDGLNFFYGDGNGDGKIDLSDLSQAVIGNFRNEHPPVGADFCPVGQEGVHPALTVMMNASLVQPGARLNVDIELGTAAIPVDQFFGIAFDINFNPAWVKPGSMVFKLPAVPWFDPSTSVTQRIFWRQEEKGLAEVAIVRRDHDAVAGYGKLGTLSFTLSEQLPVNLPAGFSIGISRIQLVDAKLNVLPVVPGVGSVIVSGDGPLNACPDVVDPVCGSNGVTYLNSCYAEAAGITDYTPGVCNAGCVDPQKMDPDATCPTAFEPVCGCNGITYANACVAEANGVVSFMEGPCSSNNSCYDPVLVLTSAGTSVNTATGVISISCPAGYNPV